jgi:hypothetical protein
MDPNYRVLVVYQRHSFILIFFIFNRLLTYYLKLIICCKNRNTLKQMAQMDTGPPHFRSMLRQYKNSGYTLSMIMKEYIDNAGKIAAHIDSSVNVSPSGMIERITISDDCKDGFVNINESGERNPFTLGHTRAGQDSDDELSEFGVGMKAAAMAAGKLFTVYTNVGGICYKVEFDFEKMESEPSVNESYKPEKSIIDMDEYRSIHPFPYGSTIVLGKLYPTLHEITSQQQIQKEFLDAISDAYSHYIQNGLIIRVNGVVVEEEHDWFSDETCRLFAINTKLILLEKADSPRILFAIRTGQKITYKKYDTGQKRWKQCGQKELEQLTAQGYTISHPLKSNDIHAIEINSTIAFYSDEFDKEIPPEPPLNHVHVHKDGRKYGSHTFEHRTDGNCNYNCHKIDFKSKKIGKELGITYNKQMKMDRENELTRALHEIVADNNSNLNANTSTSKNQELCQRYLDKMKVDIMTCPMRKLSTYHKERRALLAQQPVADPAADPVANPVANPAANPAVDPVVDPVANPVDPVADPVANPVVDPVANPAANPAVDPVANPAANPAVDPVANPAANPVADQLANPAVDPVVDPAANPVDDPVVDPVVNPVDDPVVDPVADLEYYITYGGTMIHLNDMDKNQLEALHNKVCSLLGRSFP